MVTSNSVETKLVSKELARERHEELISATIKLLLHTPFHKLTMRQIARGVGWHPGRLYLYISCKEDVLFLIIDSITKELFGSLSSLPPQPTARESLVAACRHLFYTVHRLRAEAHVISRDSASLPREQFNMITTREREGHDFIADIIRRGVESGEFRPVDCDMVAYDAVMFATAWAIRQWALPNAEQLTIDHYFEHHLRMLFASLLTTPEE
jgi:AcrR family transcriptional regulator